METNERKTKLKVRLIKVSHSKGVEELTFMFIKRPACGVTIR